MGHGPRAAAWGRLALLVCAFFAALAPSLPLESHYHGDERFYTDAALEMAETGDLLTPRYADGSPRFLKPALVYWVLLKSHALLGASQFSSRLPLLLAGCLTLAAAWELARRVFRDEGVAFLAAALLASNVQVAMLSIRATPDMLQSLFLAVSLCGFAGILMEGRRGFAAHGLAYLGAGLAMAAKGLLGPLLVLFAFVVALLQGPKGPGVRALLHPGWMAAGAALGLSWFALAFAEHGASALMSFVRDQTAAQGEVWRFYVPANLAEYSAAALRHFLPWSALLLVGFFWTWRPFGAFLRTHAPAVLFLGGWFVLLVAVFSLGPLCRTRYILPAYPGLAVLAAALLHRQLEEPRAAAWLKAASRALLGAGLLAGAVLLLVGLRLDARVVLAGAVLAGTAGALLWAARRARPAAVLAAPAWFLLAVFFAVLTCVQPVFDPSPVPAVLKGLGREAAGGRPVAALGAPDDLLAWVRLASAGRLDLHPFPAETSPADLEGYDAVLLPEELRGALEAEGWDLQETGRTAEHWSARHLLRLLRTGDREAFDAATSRRYYLARPPA